VSSSIISGEKFHRLDSKVLTKKMNNFLKKTDAFASQNYIMRFSFCGDNRFIHFGKLEKLIYLIRKYKL